MSKAVKVNYRSYEDKCDGCGGESIRTVCIGEDFQWQPCEVCRPDMINFSDSVALSNLRDDANYRNKKEKMPLFDYDFELI